MNWVSLTLVSAVCYAFRYFIVKQKLSDADSSLTAFITRLIGFFIVIYLLTDSSFSFPKSTKFWGITLTTSILTAIATILQLNAIQKHDLSYCIPFQAFIPLLMLGPVYLLFDQTPGKYSLAGVILMCAGAFVLQLKEGFHIHQMKHPLILLGISAIYALTTSLDRIAIHSLLQGGFFYPTYFLMVSTLILALWAFIRQKWGKWWKQMKELRNPLILQALFGAGGFYLQMMAIEKAVMVKGDVILVKALILIQILISVFLGNQFLQEKNGKTRFLGALLMTLGAGFIVYFR